MIDKEKIAKLAVEYLEGSDKFLCEVQIKQGNIITISIDGDSFVSIDDCIHLSKTIESKLDRDAEDFELRVSSFGADKPLIFKRQYHKNVGRQLNITINEDKKITGILKSVENDTLVIETTPKKNTESVVLQMIPFDEIKEARVVLKFK
jgi:ribosome maturation factor RimP